MITRFDHIGIAVKTLEGSLPFWAEALGMDVADIETVESEQVKVAILRSGDACVELLESTQAEGPIAKFLARRGAGIHHMTLEVPDLSAMLDRLRERKVPLVGQAPRSGAGGKQVAFLHPRGTGGVLVELVQAPSAEVATSRLGPGAAVLLYLHTPQEKLWGVLRRLDATGVVLEGIDLGSFDDWVAQLEREEQRAVGPSIMFIPMTRLEKILLDCSSGELPSLAERFERRIGRTVQQTLDGRGASDRDG